ncbi:MAG: TolC family protein, partial [Candidatus Margulisiibacteriota bacterium]
SKEKIDAITEEVTVNEDAFKLMNSRYNLGDVTNLELLDAHNQLLNARKNLVEAKIDCANQILRYLRATGQLLSYFKKGVSK